MVYIIAELNGRSCLEAKRYASSIRRAAKALALLPAILLILILCSTAVCEDATYHCGDITYTLDEAGQATITGYKGSAKTLAIPAALNGHRVIAIGADAFADCYGLTSVVIPDGVTSIGNDAFYSCRNLTSIDIPEGVTSIGNKAFYYCYQLTNIVIPDGVMSIGVDAFYDCKSLTGIDIPGSVTSIVSGAFNLCDNLTYINVDEENAHYKSIDGVLFDKAGYLLHTYPAANQYETYAIPNGVTHIEDRAFFWCKRLTGVVMPNGLTSIGDMAFSGCDGLTVINIPDSVTSIGDRAFLYCDKLTDIRIPEGVTRIGSGAFAICASLTSIVIPSGVTSIGDNAFLNCINLIDIELPDSVTSIEDRAFDGTHPGLKLKVVRNSYAERYAACNLIAYEYIG